MAPSSFNVDTCIFLAFLLLNLAVGLYYGRGVKTLREFSVGKGEFSTLVLAMTIVATRISSSLFNAQLTYVYDQGMFGIAMFGAIGIAFFLFGLLLLGSGEFFRYISIVDAMKSIYGNAAGMVTAAVATGLSVCLVVLQFQLNATIIGKLLNVDSLYATILTASIVIFYSALGGIRSVIFTDALQFVILGVFLPLLLIVIVYNLKTASDISLAVAETFDVTALVRKPIVIGDMIRIAVCTFFIPPLFQRMKMAGNVYRAKSHFSMPR